MGNLLSNVIGTVVGVLVGSWVTYLVSRHYYLKAGEDLAVAATELRGLATLIIRGLEQAGLATFTRDSAGKPIGLVTEASAHMVGTGKLTANVEVISAALESVTDQT